MNQPYSPLRKARKQLRLKGQFVADAVGVGQDTISRTERGLTKPSPALAEKLTNFFQKEGVDINEIHILYPERFMLEANHDPI